ncbi:hypothetical protein SLS55_001547 [Diplodia seriata]|uniref:Heterokaryon incompatibility domain-containing protein n=1 Tax=Diplodia seriata TaxID=420778 RepID=A0ABR3CPT8_9PEZI
MSDTTLYSSHFHPEQSENSNQFTRDRVRKTLRDALYVRPAGIDDYPWEFSSASFDHDLSSGVLTPYDDPLRFKRAASACEKLVEQVRDPEGHAERLDREFSQLLEFNVINFEGREDGVVDKTCHLLSRLPRAVPTYWEPRAAATCNGLDERYFIDRKGGGREVKRLRAARYLGRNVIRMALRAALWPGSRPPFISNPGGVSFANAFHRFINMIAELLEASLQMKPAGASTPGHLLVVRVYLWAAWHRCISIHHWHALLIQQQVRITSARESLLSLPRGSGIIGKVRQALAQEGIVEDPPPLPRYMCRSAFQILRSRQESDGLDFRHVVSTYGKLFGHLPARCIVPDDDDGASAARQCSGENPGLCQRFVGGTTRAEQSAHAPRFCAGTRCYRVFWDEASYRSVVDGARAVRVDGPANDGQQHGVENDDGLLTYCAASTDTMAVSHVWSHGQGGRPDRGSTGFNVCLHRRYSAIARRHGCRSYWMDTACIPDDPVLRREAIAQINRVFGASRLTLVCDRDLMDVDVRRLTVPLGEAIVAALLFCDWNVRAWTLLEGVMGVRNLHLLCKDDRVLRFADVVEVVHAEGRVDLVNTLLSSHHLLPRSDAAKPVRVHERGHAYRRNVYGFGVGEAASLLAHRHATRERDETIIWSILSERRGVCYSPAQFWGQTSGVRTGMLMSHVPRIEAAKGLSWAPRRPGLPLQRSGRRAQCPPYPGEGSALGIISDEGLTADWMLFDFDRAGDVWSCSRKFSVFLWQLLTFVWSGTVGNLVAGYFPLVNAIILADFMRKASYWPRVALIPTETKQLCARHVASLKVGAPHVAFIRPARDTIEPLPYPYAGDSNRVLLALITSEDEGRWTWREVVDWDMAVALPPFRAGRLLIE